MKKSLVWSLVLGVFMTASLAIGSIANAGPGGDYISVAELKTMIDEKNPNLVLFGVLHDKKRYIPLNNAGKPIDGSFTMWRPDYSGTGSKEAAGEAVNGFRKSQGDMETLLSGAGLTPESIVVVYSADAMHDAARVYWQLKLMGQPNVKLLDGGVNAWLEAGNDSGDSTDLVDAEKKGDYKAASYDVAKFDKTITEVMTALDNPEEWVVIDTRSKSEFDGEKSGSSTGAYGTGALKGSVHIEWKQALNKDQTLKSKEELEAIYGDVIKDKKVITLCQSGVRSAHTYAVLKNILDFDDVYNYDGSWIELSYVASDASNGKVDEALKENVKKHLVNWKDNKEPI